MSTPEQSAERELPLEGSLAIIDCLGFKGVWAYNKSPLAIVDFLKQTRKSVDEWPISKALNLLSPGQIRRQIAFVSDTVVVSYQTNSKDVQPAGRGYLVCLAAMTAIELVQRFSVGPVPLSLRGCITYGMHLVDENFFLGPAVDEAASLSEVADGSFIWATPTASNLFYLYAQHLKTDLPIAIGKLGAKELIQTAEVVIKFIGAYGGMDVAAMEKEFNSFGQEHKTQVATAILRIFTEASRTDFFVRNYALPMREGSPIVVDVLNPFAMSTDETHLRNTWNQLLSPFQRTSGIDVLRKRQNSYAFFVRAIQESREAMKRAGEALQRIQTELGPLALTPPPSALQHAGSDGAKSA